jgi:hypothetical protein
VPSGVGLEVLNPALPDDDLDVAVRIAQAEYDRHQPDVVVGFSRSGAVAMNIETGDTPLVLLCPAWKTWGTATTVKSNTTILHIVVGTEHRLADEESLAAMLRTVEHSVRLRWNSAQKSRY